MKSIASGAAILTIAFVVGFSTAPAFAGNDQGNGRGNSQGHGWGRDRGNGHGGGGVTQVPEIDAASGLAALAAVGATLAFARERRRNR